MQLGVSRMNPSRVFQWRQRATPVTDEQRIRLEQAFDRILDRLRVKSPPGASLTQKEDLVQQAIDGRAELPGYAALDALKVISEELAAARDKP